MSKVDQTTEQSDAGRPIATGTSRWRPEAGHFTGRIGKQGGTCPPDEPGLGVEVKTQSEVPIHVRHEWGEPTPRAARRTPETENQVRAPGFEDR
ncbi:hypothetical protein ColTof4_10389 [Colletotrichum tofieldiae]|nr:hypothetical protein ColTof3_05955 [Colletotrichum tofieldiae]GKT77966.1 hypothetical protein ColTof4_10389 [Colletotrichum tofieldiae]